MNLSRYFDPNQLPPELFQKFLIPLPYYETLQHCQAYYLKNNIHLCESDLWKMKVKYYPKKERQSLLHQAANEDWVYYVPALLEDENVDPAANNNEVIQLAAASGNVEIVKLLLSDSRVDPSARGNEAIKLAAENGWDEVVKLLLTDKRVNPADPNFRKIKVYLAYRFMSVSKLLIQDGRINPTLANNYPIKEAIVQGNIDIVKLLLADPRVDPAKEYNLPLRLAVYNLPLRLAVIKGNIAIVKLLLADKRVNPVVLDNSAIKDAIDHKQTLVVNILFCWYCSFSDNLDEIMKLTTLKPLYSIGLKFACYYQKYNNIKILLKAGADIRVQNNYCMSISKMRNDMEMIKILKNV